METQQRWSAIRLNETYSHSAAVLKLEQKHTRHNLVESVASSELLL